MAFPGRGSAGLLLLVVGVLAAADVASATVYRVGDNANWTVPSQANDDLYEDWVANRTFNFGDELIFYYLPSAHDVLLVNSSAYEDCDIAADPIQKWVSGADSVLLNRNNTPNYYFICGFTGHCAQGQKIHIAVNGVAGSPPSGTNETLSPPSGSGTDSTVPLPLAGVILSIAMVCVTTLLM